MRKYQLPEFLAGQTTQAAYGRWLARKASTHVKRDRRRGNAAALREAYKLAIHRAAIESDGYDMYTGEKLRWDLISSYDNEKSKLGRRQYKATLSYLPTVDHVGDGLGAADFKICSWRTNDAKNDLSYTDFVDLCGLVVDHFNAQAKATSR